MALQKLCSDNKGLTLVELLASLAIIGIISVAIVAYAVDGMKSFRNINEEIVMHQEANYVMTTFTNHVFQAISVEKQEQPGFSSLLKVENADGKVSFIGFNNENQAIIGNKNEDGTIECEVLHSSRYSFTGDSSVSLKENQNSVTIKLNMVDSQSPDNTLALENEVSFMKISSN